MNINEAIERLETCMGGWPAKDIEKYMEAVGLGIKALNRIKIQRVQGKEHLLLEGETN